MQAPPANLSLRQLRAFQCIAQEGSMALAARRLHVTPAALSMLVRDLEALLGVRLFERTTRKLELTAAGSAFKPGIDLLFGDLARSVAHARQAAMQAQARAVVATSPLLASGLVPRAIASYRAKHPHTELRLVDVGVESVPEAVRQRRADIGLCTAGSGQANLHATPMFEDTLTLACPPGHALAAKKSVRWAQLAGERLILLAPGSGLRTLVDRTAQSLNLPLVPAYEVAHVASAVGLAEAGEGVAVLPSSAVSRALGTRKAKGPSLAAVALTHPIVTRQVVALSASPPAAGGLVEAFIAHLAQVARRY